MERVLKPVRLRDVIVRSERFRCMPCKRLWAPYELWRRMRRRKQKR